MQGTCRCNQRRFLNTAHLAKCCNLRGGEADDLSPNEETRGKLGNSRRLGMPGQRTRSWEEAGGGVVVGGCVETRDKQDPTTTAETGTTEGRIKYSGAKRRVEQAGVKPKETAAPNPGRAVFK